MMIHPPAPQQVKMMSFMIWAQRRKLTSLDNWMILMLTSHGGWSHSNQPEWCGCGTSLQDIEDKHRRRQKDVGGHQPTWSMCPGPNAVTKLWNQQLHAVVLAYP